MLCPSELWDGHLAATDSIALSSLRTKWGREAGSAKRRACWTRHWRVSLRSEKERKGRQGKITEWNGQSLRMENSRRQVHVHRKQSGCGHLRCGRSELLESNRIHASTTRTVKVSWISGDLHRREFPHCRRRNNGNDPDTDVKERICFDAP